MSSSDNFISFSVDSDDNNNPPKDNSPLIYSGWIIEVVSLPKKDCISYLVVKVFNSYDFSSKAIILLIKMHITIDCINIIYFTILPILSNCLSRTIITGRGLHAIGYFLTVLSFYCLNKFVGVTWKVYL